MITGINYIFQFVLLQYIKHVTIRMLEVQDKWQFCAKTSSSSILDESENTGVIIRLAGRSVRM